MLGPVPAREMARELPKRFAGCRSWLSGKRRVVGNNSKQIVVLEKKLPLCGKALDAVGCWSSLDALSW